ncbi:MAG: efflux RND transporter periplasmic adaptor subunit [Candidatus Eisenbacteria bacterium]|uniref:Efflux RND transporter periplasmic adaptor subunit n=1 Tax=Eiseniibacteriota bacterium TaxID=2212470 RepID=A0A538TSM1_UNCEI|nr:MAG: efflux RND transporter periplasmic adaptor subunit [Candidatus Eisenbacteria bacterium]
MSGGGKRILWIGIGTVVLLVIVISNLRRSAGGQVAVQAGDVKRGSISATVRAPGRVQPETQVKLSANVPGQVVRLSVKEGDRVRKGQFLLQIDDTQYRAQLREATAALAAARSNLRLTDAALQQSEASLQRKESLAAQKLVSPEELDQARTQRNSDKARVDSNREEVEREMAAVQVSEDYLRKTRFDAPIDGTITQLSIERGEIAVIGTMNNPGTVILTVADLARMKVEADVDETDVSTVTLGQSAEVKVDALPDTTLTGRVSDIANSPTIEDVATQEQQTNFKVDVMIDNPPRMLRPGMTADVEIKTATRDSVLTVPIQSVVVRTPDDLKPPVKGKRKSAPRDAKADEAGPTAAPTDPKAKKTEEIRGVFVIVGGKAEFPRATPTSRSPGS